MYLIYYIMLFWHHNYCDRMLFIYFRNGKCLTNEFFKGCGKEIQFTLSTENIIYITTIMAFWASMHRQRNSVFLLPTVITMLDGNHREEVKLWLACVAGGNVHSRKVLEENAAKTLKNGGRDATKTLTRKNNSAG